MAIRRRKISIKRPKVRKVVIPKSKKPTAKKRNSIRKSPNLKLHGRPSKDPRRKK